MSSSTDEFQILHRFNVPGKPRKEVLEVLRKPPAIGWVKVNTDGSAIGFPSIAATSAIF